jgi:hypothetical protein
MLSDEWQLTTTQGGRFSARSRRSPLGQEDQFRPPSLSGRCAFAEETFARTHRKEEDAPQSDHGATAVKFPQATRLSRSQPGPQGVGLMIDDLPLARTRGSASRMGRVVG